MMDLKWLFIAFGVMWAALAISHWGETEHIQETKRYQLYLEAMKTAGQVPVPPSEFEEESHDN